MLVNWRKAPVLVLCVASGGYFAIGMGLYGRFLTGASTRGAVLGGCVGGVIFGLIIGPVQARAYARERQAAGPAEPGVYDLAVRAASRGPAPRDPAVRQVAARIVNYRLVERQRPQRREPTFVFLAVAAALSVVLAVTQSVVYVAVAVAAAAVLVKAVREPHRLERRAALLSPPGTQSAEVPSR